MRSAVLLRGLYEMLGNKRTGNGRYQRVLLHVHAIRLNGGHAVLLRKLIFGVDNDGFHRTAIERTLAYGLHILAALTQVEGNGNDIAAGHLCQVWNGYRGIEATGIGQDYACRHAKTP